MNERIEQFEATINQIQRDNFQPYTEQALKNALAITDFIEKIHTPTDPLDETRMTYSSDCITILSGIDTTKWFLVHNNGNIEMYDKQRPSGNNQIQVTLGEVEQIIKNMAI